jgi:hypothetical protein
LKFRRDVAAGIDAVNAGRIISVSQLCDGVGGGSCVQYRQFRERNPQKSSEQTCGQPNNCSAHALQTSQARSGLKTPRHNLRRLRAAALERLNIISAASVIGQAMHWLRSSPKSSGATPCETSKSVHGHSRRAF